jgi:hypothetical protein
VKVGETILITSIEDIHTWGVLKLEEKFYFSSGEDTVGGGIYGDRAAMKLTIGEKIIPLQQLEIKAETVYGNPVRWPQQLSLYYSMPWSSSYSLCF